MREQWLISLANFLPIGAELKIAVRCTFSVELSANNSCKLKIEIQ